MNAFIVKNSYQMCKENLFNKIKHEFGRFNSQRLFNLRMSDRIYIGWKLACQLFQK